MYQLWLTKQVSDFGGTGHKLHQISEAVDSSCPNCGIPGERACHLNLCPDAGRTQLFREGVDELQQWMDRTPTHHELAEWIPRYVGNRGRVLFTALGPLSYDMQCIAEEQDDIGWDKFLEGRITRRIGLLQEVFLQESPTKLTLRRWMSQFITRLLNISHSQWIYRNITLHHTTAGVFQQRERQALVREIEHHLNLPAEEVPDSHQFLLEIDLNNLSNMDTPGQEYWLLAARAAR